MANSKINRGKAKLKESATDAIVSAAGDAEPGKEVALKRDRFDDFLFNAANYIYLRRKLFITLSIVLVIVLVSGWGTYKYIEHQDNLRNEELFKIEQQLNRADLSDDLKAQQVMPLLDKFLSQYQGTSQYTIALFYRAGLHTQRKELQAAQNDLTDLRTHLEAGSDLYFLASLYLSNILRDQNKIPEAFTVLESVKTEAVADIILMEQAEIHINQNQTEKAKELLQILIKDYPKSFYTNKARQLLEIL